MSTSYPRAASRRDWPGPMRSHAHTPRMFAPPCSYTLSLNLLSEHGDLFRTLLTHRSEIRRLSARLHDEQSEHPAHAGRTPLALLLGERGLLHHVLRETHAETPTRFSARHKLRQGFEGIDISGHPISSVSPVSIYREIKVIE